jgi:hypothetical protein
MCTAEHRFIVSAGVLKRNYRYGKTIHAGTYIKWFVQGSQKLNDGSKRIIIQDGQIEVSMYHRFLFPHTRNRKSVQAPKWGQSIDILPEMRVLASPIQAYSFNELILRSWALLERKSVVQPLDSFPVFHRTRRFIISFTRAFHLYLSWSRPIQSIPSYPISKRSILMLSIHLRLGLPSGLFPCGFPTSNLYTFLFSLIRATCPTHLILLDLIILIILGEEYKEAKLRGP